MILADKIIEERKKNGWSQEELANKLGVSRLFQNGKVQDLYQICKEYFRCLNCLV